MSRLPYINLSAFERAGADQAIKAIAAAVTESLGLPASARAGIERQVRAQASFRITTRHYGMDEALVSRIEAALRKS